MKCLQGKLRNAEKEVREMKDRLEAQESELEFERSKVKEYM